MERYRSISSGVSGYEIGDDYVLIKFKSSRRTYRYSYRKAGKFKVDKIKSLAVRGKGLNGYINSYAKYSYD